MNDSLMIIVLFLQKPMIVHVLGHTLGLGHEHMRKDRDDYLEINKENVEGGLVSK